MGIGSGASTSRSGSGELTMTVFRGHRCCNPKCAFQWREN